MEVNRKLIGATTACLVAAIAGCSGGVSSHTTGQANVFGSEEQAAYEGSFNRLASAPLATLDCGATVTVLDDTYGKDYWACYVRTANGQKGWVLCTSLDYKRSAGT
jgi:hypothetical protein